MAFISIRLPEINLEAFKYLFSAFLKFTKDEIVIKVYNV